MDNITHSVVGLGVGALIDRSLPAERDAAHARTRQRMLLTIGCLASNFPDLDLVLTRLLDAPLGYLLMHRGHTHTLVAAIGEAALLLGLVWLLWPNARRLLRASRGARAGAVLAAGAGLVLHLSMDALNVYGVHPFWPFDPDWYYGDLVFIVEPVFWVAFGIPLAALAPRPGWRRLLLGLLLAVPLGATVAGFLHPLSLAGLAVLALLLAWVERRNAPAEGRAHRGRAALAAGLAASLALVAVQGLALHQARAVVAATLRGLDPGERLLDAALSAYPANPLCWSFVSVAVDGEGAAMAGAGAVTGAMPATATATDAKTTSTAAASTAAASTAAASAAAPGTTAAAGSLHLRRGLLSIAPGIVPVASCPAGIAGHAPAGATAQLAWLSEQRETLAALRGLARRDCHVNAWMRFARAPSLADGLATDMRWGPPGARNFSTLDVAAQAQSPCPHPVPGWGYPRADLLGQH